MRRIILQRLNPVGPTTAFRQIQLFPPPRVYRRHLSFLSEKSEYLLKLLNDNGFRNLQGPLQGLSETINESGTVELGSGVPSILRQNRQVLEADWMIDRSNACIRCSLKLSNKSDNLKDALVVRIGISYPEYGDKVTPPEIPALLETDSPKAERIRQFMNSMWRTFCVNDLLKLNVTASIDVSGKLEVSGCDAVVDECAIHRQSEVFKHVVRNDLPVEIEAEKHLLVYRKYLPPLIQLTV